MAEPKQKEGEFDEWIMGDMHDVLKGHTFALEALAELLTSSTLEAFSEGTGGKRESANLRWGLLQLFELYLERHQRTLEEFLEKFNNLDLVLLKRGKNLLKLVRQGAYNREEVKQEMLKEAIAYLDIVIERDGQFKDEAEEVKGMCLERRGEC